MWPLSFISKENLSSHVRDTIKQYGEKLVSFDCRRFNKNFVDPIKLIFDKSVYKLSWEDVIQNEIQRQRDKSNNNDIGYFHQRIFKYIKHCEVPKEYWDVIYMPDQRIELQDGSTVKTIYVEMKNKHNTMNSSASAKTYMKMQDQILKDDDCECFLVEIIAKRSQNIPWEASVDGRKCKHKHIRRVSVDEFYKIVTGQENAFYQLCLVLPDIIDSVVEGQLSSNIPHDTVFSELNNLAHDNKMSFSLALYMLGFSTYHGFGNIHTERPLHA